MPNRIIKESICYSDDIDKLSWFEEVVFYRLLVRCDDYGRIDARINFLKSMLFATKKGVTDKSVLDALSHLAEIGIIQFYRSDGKQYLFLPNWGKHQRIRDSRAKYPEPIDITDLRQVAANCGEPPPESQSQSVSNPNPNPSSCPPDYDFFSIFWKEYPKKDKRAEAEKKFKKLKMNEQLMDKVMNSLFRFKESKDWLKDEGQFVPMAVTWINQRRWEDEF